ncbi:MULTISPECIES: MurR/RpiR family transcriptional regulator [unclassified Lactococcus]|uniref:MurR/RpiR family transcriptional regulator n=1 Tax=unclassified Lactococcus TaxID=2643510 RepID=UPI0011C7A449|nr:MULTISPECIES: MurR/RpiR family transcriptional regulator [unclassified Lactococcus]MQW22196.1 SIS domain-containing protein [Lactococcus sp. dk101]TXK45129.1 MurR/RpiR family transcriptional regulator [Lactococcus sp. dk310]TXK51091.1 MurR/RpiR family transcriptional regulator [Lactococcus sp. dk322]
MNFIPEKVRTLNELEASVFNYILANMEAAQAMTVRECAEKVHVSTATVMRMANKLGFHGWADLRFYLKNSKEVLEVPVNYYENLVQLDLFLRSISEKTYAKLMDDAVELIRQARYVVFIGLGTSGALAQYGARYFSNIGLESYAISDPYQAVKGQGAADVLTIVLSASGETDKMIDIMLKLRKEADSKLISITNTENTTVSKLSNINLTYNFQTEFSEYDPLENLTSQLPVLALIEILAHQATEK